MSGIKGRANTPSEKKEFMDKLLVLWNNFPRLRLGQLLVGITDDKGIDLFYIEEQDLLDLIAE